MINAQLIKLGNGKFVVVNERNYENKIFPITTLNWNGSIVIYTNELEIQDGNRGEIIGANFLNNIPAISNIDKVFEMWKEANVNMQQELDYYIKQHKTQEECMGFIDGFLAARKDYYSTEILMGFMKWVNNEWYSDNVGRWYKPKEHVQFVTEKELFHLYQLSLIPNVLNIEFDEINNKILKVII